MSRIFVFADEAGNFDFTPGKQDASRYFIVTTVTMPDCTVGDELLSLRRELTFEGFDLSKGFHASTDRQAVRNEVYRVLAGHSFRIDATILEKRKALPRIKADPAYFYQLALFLHLRFLAPRIANRDDELLVVGASLQVNWKKSALREVIDAVVKQVAPTSSFQSAFWPAESDPCLQVADYCSWAIQRKWERGDERSYDLISNRIASEYRAFRR